MNISRRQVIQTTGQFIIAVVGTLIAELTVLAVTTQRFPNLFELYMSVLIALGAGVPIASAIFGLSKIPTQRIAGR